MAGVGDPLLLTRPWTFERAPLQPVHEAGGAIRVDVHYVGICGTDLHIAAGEHPRASFPLAIGHEILGSVDDGSASGQLVVVDPLISCGDCGACRNGIPHVCDRLRLIGIDVHGGLAGQIVVDRDRLHLVPAGVRPPVVAALAEPLAVAVHAVGRSPVGSTSTVLIIGAGPIGLLLSLLARQAGAMRIIVAEPSSDRRSAAAALGFEVLDAAGDLVDDLVARTDGALVDVAFDAAAVPSVAAVMPRLVRPGGTVAIVGVHAGPTLVDLQAVVFREITFVGHRVYTPQDIEIALSLLASGAVDVAPLITDVVPVDAAAGVFERLRAGDGLKFLIDMRSER